MHRIKFISALLPWLIALSTSAEISVTTVFNPPRIAMGDQAQYVVEVKETSTNKQPEVERVTSLPIAQSGGLALTNGRTSTSQRTNIINGAAEYNVTQQLIIDAKPPRVGKFTIPTYVFQYKGQTYRAPAATLEVVERSEDAGPTTDELIFLKADTPDQLYVGQTTPLQLKLYISEGVRLTGLNSFDRSADGFTISELPENLETTEIVKGRRYRVLTWPLTITPIQTGEQDLNFQFTVSASLPGQNNRRDPFGGRSFGSSVFGGIFGRTERFTLYTEPTQVEVLPLPTTGQPSAFTGAIGDFTMQVYTDRKSTQAGEPIMLSVEISGSGNFDRINGPAIPETDAWRSYDPESIFQPRTADSVLRGTKRFDYVMIPNQAGTIEIPEISFAYFESQAKRYTELRSPTISIEVSPSDQPATSTAPSIQAPTPRTEVIPLQQELSMEEALLTLDYRPKASNRIGASTWKDTRFWAINALIALILIATCFWLSRKRRLAEDPAYADRHAAKREYRTAKTAAQQAKDAESFYAHAQSAIRLAVTCRTTKNHRTANTDKLSAAMQSVGVSQQTIAQISELFATADAQRFAGKATADDLSTAKSELERILKAL